MKRLVVKLLAFVLLGLSFYFGSLSYKEFKPLVETKIQNNAIKEVVVVVDDPNDPYNRVIDFEALKKINKDVVGWIYIPDTPVDYPILVGESDEEYLYKDIEGNHSKYGSIFSYADTNRDLMDARTVLFGHNMRQMQMFGSLKKYLDADYRTNHSKIYIYTEKKTMELSLFSMFVCNESDDIFWDSTELGSLEYQELLQNLSNRNQYSDISRENLGDLYNNQSFTLVTCKGSAGTTNRLVINSIVDREKYLID